MKFCLQEIGKLFLIVGNVCVDGSEIAE